MRQQEMQPADALVKTILDTLLADLHATSPDNKVYYGDVFKYAL